MPFGRADLMLDGNPTRAAILAQLTALEAEGAGRAAAPSASSRPCRFRSQTVAEWAEGLEERGFVLVPASTLMGGS